MSHEGTGRGSEAASPHEMQLRGRERQLPAGLAAGEGAAAGTTTEPSGPEHPVAPSFDKLRGAALSTLWFSVDEPPNGDHEAA